MFSVPKEGSERSPIIDLSDLNRSLKKKGFKMEDLGKVAKNISRGLWGVKVDLKDAYFHIPLDPEYQKYFAFALGGRTFCFQVLPFGLSSAPWTFTRVMKPIKVWLRLRNIRVSSFLDDFLILASSFRKAIEHTSMLIDLLQKLGFRINWGKSSLEPQRRLQYLGVMIDLESLSFSLPEEKVQAVLAFCRQGQRVPSLTRRELEKLVGYFNFVAKFLNLGRLYLKPIQAWMNANSSVLSRDSKVPLDEVLREALLPWADPDFLRSPVPIKERLPSIEIVTDASDFGWSGILLLEVLRGEWPPALQSMSINWKELKAIHLTLLGFPHQLKGKCVKVWSDSRTALSCIRK